MWTRLCNLRVEANLPPLTNRIAARNTAIMAKAQLPEKPSVTKSRSVAELPEQPELQT